MILTASQVAFNYILKSKLRQDYKHILGIPYTATTRWKPEAVMRKLVDSGLAKVTASNVRTGEIMEIYTTGVSIEQVEDLCLTPADKARIDKWLAKGVK